MSTTLKSLYTPPAPPSSGDHDYQNFDSEMNLGWEEFDSEYSDFNSGDEFLADETAWGEGHEAESPPTAQSLPEIRLSIKDFEAQVRNDPTLSPERKEKILEDLSALRGRINTLAARKPELQAAGLEEASVELARLESALQSAPAVADMIGKLEEKIAALESKAVPAALEGKKQELLEQLGKIKGEVELSGDAASLEKAAEALAETEIAFEEVEGAIAEQEAHFKAPLENLAQYLQGKGVDVTTQQVGEALQEVGLSEQDLQNITLPSSAETHQKLFDLVKKLDPHFSQLLQDHADNPYHEEVLSRFAETLSALLPSASMGGVEKVLKDAASVSWPSAGEIKKFLAGDDYAKHAANMLNQPNGILEAMESGNWENFLASWVNVGDGLDWNKGHAGSAMRRFLGGLFAACDHNPGCFQQMLRKHIPQDVLVDILALLNVPGQHHKLGGDVLDNLTLFSHVEKALGNESVATPLPSPAPAQ